MQRMPAQLALPFEYLAQTVDHWPRCLAKMARTPGVAESLPAGGASAARTCHSPQTPQQCHKRKRQRCSAPLHVAPSGLRPPQRQQECRQRCRTTATMPTTAQHYFVDTRRGGTGMNLCTTPCVELTERAYWPGRSRTAAKLGAPPLWVAHLRQARIQRQLAPTTSPRSEQRLQPHTKERNCAQLAGRQEASGTGSDVPTTHTALAAGKHRQRWRRSRRQPRTRCWLGDACDDGAEQCARVRPGVPCTPTLTQRAQLRYSTQDLQAVHNDQARTLTKRRMKQR